MTLKSKVIDCLKAHPGLYNLCLQIRFGRPVIRRLLPLMVRFPNLHSWCLVKLSDLYSFGRTYPRNIPLNLKKPEYFNEKLLWLKYYKYNKDPLCEECFDKYTVRDYVERCGYPDILNELYGVWDSVESIPWENLPEEYALKKTNGCGHHVFRHTGEPFDVEKEKCLLGKSSRKEILEFKASGDLFATRQKQRYICEKLIESQYGFRQPEDYKFYCFHGEPEYLLYIFDRHNSFSHRTAFMDVQLRDRSDLYRGAEPYVMKRPACYESMLEICRKLAEPFPFVRVDFYIQNEKPVFGEMTFTPFGSYVLNHVFDDRMNIHYDGLLELGEKLHLEGRDRKGP